MKLNVAPEIGLKQTTIFADTNKERKLRKACTDFEAIMLQQVLSMMRKSVPEGGLYGKGFASEMYQSMYDREMAESLARSNRTGIGELLYRQLKDD